jgi:hypothetical protein
LAKTSSKNAQKEPKERENLPLPTKVLVLTESGYRCAVPTCRQILALDLHHIWEVAASGGDEPGNLIALCPTCHALYHRGTIKRESIFAWKAMLVAITKAFDLDAVDKLLFLNGCKIDEVVVSGDGLLQFGRLIAAGLAGFEQKANNNFQLVTYTVNLSQGGRLLVEAWKSGDRTKLRDLLYPKDAGVT